MNKNILKGLALVISGLGLIGVFVSSGNNPAAALLGKAAWYLPYAFLLCGVRRLVRA